jgi:hypothetical protein
MNLTSDTKNDLICAAGIAVGVLAGLFPFLWHWDKLITRDWPYFLALALVSRSNVLAYGNFPPHDPWVAGGVDILANPQSRFFSPSFLIELALPPYPAMLLILFLYGVLGAWGMFKLLRELDASRLVAVTVALFFVNSSWFGLHFAEGHLAYPAFLLFPWLLYASRKIFEPRRQVLMAGLFAFFLIDGGIYAFIFGIYMLPFLVIVDYTAWWRLLREWREHALRLGGLVVGAALIATAKVIPVMAIHQSRPPELDQTVMRLETVAYLLFYPFQEFTYSMGLRWGFHEYGCYIGIVALVVALSSLIGQENRTRSALYLVGALFFLFTATGLGDRFDPWLLIHQIPFLNQAHVQSRLTIIFFTLFCVLVGLGLRRLEHRRWVIVGICSFLLVESLVVRVYPEWRAYEMASDKRPKLSLITGSDFEGTRHFGIEGRKTTRKLRLYTDPGVATLTVYEPTRRPTSAQHKRAPGYMGEAYPLDVRGTAQIVSYEPGEVTVRYDLEEPGEVQINTNELGGWTVVDGRASVFDDPTSLLTVRTLDTSGTVTLVYNPAYLDILAGTVPAGAVIFGTICFLVFRREEPDA